VPGDRIQRNDTPERSTQEQRVINVQRCRLVRCRPAQLRPIDTADKISGRFLNEAASLVADLMRQLDAASAPSR
jgi:hypothetical protein